MELIRPLVWGGYLLLLYTVVVVAVRAVRRRDAAAVAPLAFLCVLTVVELAPPIPIVGSRHVLNALLPVSALLVLAHLRPVPRPISWVGLSVPLVVGVSFLLWEGDSTPADLTTLIYLGVAFGGLAAALGAQARGAVGVHRRRVGYVAVGFLAFALVYAGATYGTLLRTRGDLQTRRTLTTLDASANVVGLTCMFLAFAPPRRLVSRWRRSEHAAYLAGAYEREPEERGWLAAEDLVAGVQRCIAPALVVVTRPRSVGSAHLIVRASSERALVGQVFVANEGLLRRAANDQLAAVASLDQCGHTLAEMFRPYGRTVLVAPIVAGSRSWGVVCVVHRRSPLFPDDDLNLLVQLGRSAAVAFDHAQLIVERRERARHEADVRLRELESRLDLMLESIRDYAMFVVDEDGKVAGWHAGAQEMFGPSRDAMMGVSAAALFDMQPEAFAAWLADASARGKAEREGAGRRQDGRPFIAVTTIRPLIAEQAAPPGFVVVTRDVTERRGLEERLRQGQKMQAIGQLAGGIAHDFNNLLTAILGYSDWLMREMTDDPKVEQVQEIHRAAERAADLTRQLLAFSRRQVVQVSSLDVTRLIRGLLPMLRRLIGQHVEIVDATSLLAAPVLGDRSQLEQVVINLVLNARDALGAGGRITIRTADVEFDGDTRRPDGAGHVLLEVVDNGVGMDADTRRRAFEPFFTTKSGGRGTGLGLATVYGAVQQMSGLIEVDSTPGRGTTIRIYLPHANRPVSEAGEAAPSPTLTGRETVLLIEDDDALRTYLVHVLEAHGYHVIPAEGAEAALTVTEAEVQTVDLVISDVAMRGMSGPEVVAELSAMRPGLPALYISGSGDALPGPDEPALGPILHKPFTSSDLLSKVREVLSVA